MNHDSQLKIQAYLDGELPPRQAREIESLVASDAEAQAVLAGLKDAKSLLVEYEAEIKHPESREFFWSKIERQILSEAPRASAAPLGLLASWRRFLVPAASVAALVVLGLVAALGPNRSAGPEFEAAFSDPGGMTYRDFSSGTTLVWLSYPAENEVAEEEPDGSIQ